MKIRSTTGIVLFLEVIWYYEGVKNKMWWLDHLAHQKSKLLHKSYVNSYGWKQSLMAYLHIKGKGPIKMYCDNKSAIDIAHNPIQHDKIKYIEIDWHFIKVKLEKGMIWISYVPSQLQLVDILSKYNFTTQCFMS